tara:strand:- start:258 stop:431 length:174 start_codon:yes stop_codon:yes gene_type:complete
MIAPGTFVKNPNKPEWGIGQVQSAIKNRITVNFENAGKKMIDTNNIELEEILIVDNN